MANTVWQALESNPDTINPFMLKIGVESVECIDIISFDEEVLRDLPKPQLAVLLCLPEYDKVHALMAPIYTKLSSEQVTPPANVFFMEQNIGNACGTFALFHALANVEDIVDLGSGPFRKWLEKAKTLSVDERSALLANVKFHGIDPRNSSYLQDLEEYASKAKHGWLDSSLAAAHNEAALLGDSQQPAQVEHHFICYVNKDGTLFEIDSRAPFPRAIGLTTGDTLVKDVGVACKHLMDHLGSVSFAAMALLPRK
ncbi:ubiquitin carboxyl-terminal hydrolase, family 1 [Dictyocaulus viviparus]|uniref:Ubiquitin carboxyl-terminal hydrolase n=1 Tax=Dictyocaulus viviparus TaxID=29172 RepID=A0A0D8Y4A9_DICVI|nr:ubiquitin carboxyl-terminal hydrolase, family 1 [Dictyocaulus viviparus]